jgi:hypothetical protein
MRSVGASIVQRLLYMLGAALFCPFSDECVEDTCVYATQPRFICRHDFLLRSRLLRTMLFQSLLLNSRVILSSLIKSWCTVLGQVVEFSSASSPDLLALYSPLASGLGD